MEDHGRLISLTSIDTRLYFYPKSIAHTSDKQFQRNIWAKHSE